MFSPLSHTASTKNCLRNDQSVFHSKLCQLCITLLITLTINTNAMAAGIILNLKDADIRALISTVSKFTGKNFIVDPRVKAKVTVISATTLSPKEVYEVFLSILQVYGFAAVKTGPVIKIVPEVNAKQGPLPVETSNHTYPEDALVTKIIHLKHVPASQLVPILRPLVPQQGHLAAYNPTNTLIITDHAGNINRLLKIIARVDKPAGNEMEIIPLKHASAPELVRILNSLNRGVKQNGINDNVKLAADERTNSILMTGSRSARLKARATIAYLDTPLEKGTGNTHVIYLKYAKAKNLVKILSGIQDKKKAATRTAAGRQLSATGSLSQNTIIQADDETNSLIITADNTTLKSLQSVIRKLDIRRAQVLIEAIIAEITVNKKKELGVGIAVDGTTSKNLNTPTGISNLAGIGSLVTSIISKTAATLPAGLSLGIGRTMSSGARYALLLRALQADTNTNILSTPNIVTLDNQKAELIVGQNVPFVTGSFTGTGSTNPNNPFQTIQRQDVGLTLKVTPQINEGDTVKLDLEQETSSVIPGTSGANISTRKRSIKTSVLVDNGQILVLGGLIQEEVTDSVNKVPLLGDIPLLGKLFTFQSTTKTRQNLMVFLRPSILRDHHDSAFATSEKYNYIRALEDTVNTKAKNGYGLLNSGAPVLPPIKKIKQINKKPTISNKSTTNNTDNGDGWDDEDNGYI